MPQKIRMWEVTTENELKQLTNDGIDLENRLEDWLENDISLLDDKLLVIGRQVSTGFGTVDLLCLDSKGTLVVIEIKKGRTPRQVTSQALEYASWAKGLPYDRVKEIAEDHLKTSLDDAFRVKFDDEVPEEFSHRSLVVAENIDTSTERIVSYLSDMKVPINVATVQYAKSSDGREILAQVYLVDPEVAADRERETSRRRPYASVSELEDRAENNGVGKLYGHLRSEASDKGLGSEPRGRDQLIFYRRGSGNYQALIIVHPAESRREKGLRFRLNVTRLASVFKMSTQQIENVLPEEREPLPSEGWRHAPQDELDNWRAYRGYFRTIEEIDTFLSVLAQ